MQAHEFNIPTNWRIKGGINAVYDILSTPEEFVRWWPDVYLRVQQLKAGDEDGVGRVVVEYDWTVFTNRRWMNYLAFLLRPVFVANHRWAMEKGKQGLQRELQKLIAG